MTSPLDHVAEIAAWLAAAGLDALELEGPGGHVRLRRGDAAPRPALEAAGAPVAVVSDGPEAIASPGVGRFLRAHPLRAAPLVEPGERVAAGRTVGLLRVGSLLVPVAAPRAGVVGAPIAAEEALVGYGDPLIEWRPED